MEIETYRTADGDRVTISYDDASDFNPRDWDNLGTMVCWHGRYNLGDEQPKISPEEYLEDLPKGTAILPLYLYDHSGITMSTSAFSCPWDSGQVGFIYATPEKIRECFIDRVSDDRVIECLMGEVETYDQYLRGEVYRYEVETPEGCEACGNVEWEFSDGCGGFYGDDGLAEIKSQYPEAEVAKV